MNTPLPVSDFRRLYRELCKDGDGVKREDGTYRKEREEAFYRLGHDGISGISDKVNAGKHHGILARARTVEDPQDKLRKDMELRKKKMEVQQAMRKNDEFNEMIAAMKTKGGTFDDKFLDKLSKQQGLRVERRVGGGASGKSNGKGVGGARGSDDSTAGSARLRKGKGKGTTGAGAPAVPSSSASVISVSDSVAAVDAMMAAEREGPHHTFLPRVGNYRRAEQAVDKSYTTSGWSKAEREAMNRIYWELDRPRAAASLLGPWRAYYEDFATRFVVLFPKRNPGEVAAKVQSMVTARTFKEKGEDVFWAAQKEGRESVQKKRGTNMSMSSRFEDSNPK